MENTVVLLSADHTFGQIEGDGHRITNIVPSASTRDFLVAAQDLHLLVYLLVSDLTDNARKSIAQTFPALEVRPESDMGREISSRRLFVSANAVRRVAAQSDGCIALPHVSLIRLFLGGQEPDLQFCRLAAPYEIIDSLPDTLPYDVRPLEDGVSSFLGLLSASARRTAERAGCGIDILPFDFVSQDLFSVPNDDFFKEKASHDHLIWNDGEFAFLGLRIEDSITSFYNPAAVSSFVSHSPQPQLLEETPGAEPSIDNQVVGGAIDDQDSLLATAEAIQAADLLVTVERYSGKRQVDGNNFIRSRHVLHPDIRLTEQALVADLQALGYEPKSQPIQIRQGARANNVYADLGTGTLQPGSELVVVGCHLDSTANGWTPYDAAVDPAPGADDDASGIAAVLALARLLKEANLQLTSRVRFCFFTDEEQDRQGSLMHTSVLKDDHIKVRAAYCLDMIGYSSTGPGSSFEVHSGNWDAGLRDLSDPLALRLIHWADALGNLGPVQHYRGTHPFLDIPNRDIWDPAMGSSDHTSFHSRQYPAVLVCQDMFQNLDSEPESEGNPNYHLPTDVADHIDAEYVARITRAVALAVIESAR